ncbi:MAG: hypothetical protein IJ518_07395 [Clostridia bacterium]|nr:hypothetical protein [Clostridia bacterium]
MTQIKKWLALVLATLMLVMAFPIAALAAEDAPNAAIYVGDAVTEAVAAPGEELTFTVSVANAANITAVAYAFGSAYDAEAFSFVSGEWLLEGKLADVDAEKLNAVITFEEAADVSGDIFRFVLAAQDVEATAAYAVQGSVVLEYADGTTVTVVPSACAVTVEAACTHDWAAATCVAPKTCTLCGETEGDPIGVVSDGDYNLVMDFDTVGATVITNPTSFYVKEDAGFSGNGLFFDRGTTSSNAVSAEIGFAKTGKSGETALVWYMDCTNAATGGLILYVYDSNGNRCIKPTPNAGYTLVSTDGAVTAGTIDGSNRVLFEKGFKGWVVIPFSSITVNHWNSSDTSALAIASGTVNRLFLGFAGAYGSTFVFDNFGFAEDAEAFTALAAAGELEHGGTYVHTWNDATCTEPKVCSVCGATDGNSLGGHTWVAATCTDPKTCSVCGLTEGIPTGVVTDPADFTPVMNADDVDYETLVFESNAPGSVNKVTTSSNSGNAYEWNRGSSGGSSVVVFTVVRTNNANEEAVVFWVDTTSQIAAKVNATFMLYGKNGAGADTCYKIAAGADVFTIAEDGIQSTLQAGDQTIPLNKGFIGWYVIPFSSFVKHWGAEEAVIPGAVYQLRLAHGANYGSILWLDDIGFTADADAFVAAVLAGEETSEDVYGHSYFYPCDAHCMLCGELTNENAAHNIVHVDAVDKTCYENGNIEYWYCADCGTAWADEALTMQTNMMSVVTPMGHAEATHVEAKAPTCYENGNIEYWYCAECGQAWLDEACTLNTNLMAVVLPMGHAEATHVEAKAPTCYENGNIEYWYCAECGQAWLDEACTLNTNLMAVVLPMAHAEATHVEAKAPTCYENGNIEYWYCAECGQAWLDEACTLNTNLMAVVLPMAHAEATHVEAKDATCYEDGNIEYWYCADCGQAWLDEACTLNTNLKAVILPMAHAEATHVEASDGDCQTLGNIEYWYCAECGQAWLDEACTLNTNLLAVKTGYGDHNYVDGTCGICGDIEIAAATIGAKKYATFAEAFAAAQDDDVIVLLAPIVVNKGEALTLNKNVTITYTSAVMGEAMITNNGELTLAGNIKVIYTYTGEADSNYGKGNYTIANNGKLVIDGATVENATASMKHAFYAITNGNGGVIVLEDGLVFNTNNYAVRMFGNGSLTVNGGEIKGTRAVWMQAPGSNANNAPSISLTVNGGKLIATGESADYKLAVYSYSYGDSLKNVSITVTGGELDGDIALSGGKNKTVAEKVTITGGTITDLYSYAADEVAVKTVSVSGGTFDYDVSTYCADGYDCTVNEDGTYGVALHKHSYSEATCTEPGTCACGEVKDVALGHIIADGVCTGCGLSAEWVVDAKGRTFFLLDGVKLTTLQKIDGEHYYFSTGDGHMITDKTIWVAKNNPYGLPSGHQMLGADGKLAIVKNGWMTNDKGQTFYYINDERVKGLYEIDGDYYYFNTGSGLLTVSKTIWVAKSNAYGLACGNYEIGADGKLIVAKTGFMTANGKTYYYVDGEIVKGLYKVDDAYYYFNTGDGHMMTSRTIWVAKSNAYGLAAGNYEVGADGVIIL